MFTRGSGELPKVVVIGVEGEKLDQHTQNKLAGKLEVQGEQKTVEEMAPSKSSNKGKWMMVALSIVALLIGLALIGFGFYAFFSHGVVHGFLGNYWPLVLVGLGGIVARLGFGGAAGMAIREIYNRYINPNKKAMDWAVIEQNVERSEEASRRAMEGMFSDGRVDTRGLKT